MVASALAACYGAARDRVNTVLCARHHHVDLAPDVQTRPTAFWSCQSCQLGAVLGTQRSETILWEHLHSRC